MSKLADYKQEQARYWAETRAKWQKEAKKRFGPKRQNLVALAIERTLPKKNMMRFKEFLEMTGAGDHPDFIRLLARLGEALEAEAAKK